MIYMDGRLSAFEQGGVISDVLNVEFRGNNTLSPISVVLHQSPHRRDTSETDPSEVKSPTRVNNLSLNASNEQLDSSGHAMVAYR